MSPLNLVLPLLAQLHTAPPPSTPPPPATVPAQATPPAGPQPATSPAAAQPGPAPAESVPPSVTAPQPVSPQAEPIPPGPAPSSLAEPQAAPGADDPSQGDPPARDKDKEKKSDIEVQVEGRVMTGWELSNRHPAEEQSGREGVRQRFFLDQARLNTRFRFNPRLKAKVSADFADALGSTEQLAFLRDAWGNIKIVRPFQIRIGRLKRPFSRLERRGASKLAFRGRGLFNKMAIEQLNFGDRAVGLMLWGELKQADLEWHVMVSNPRPSGDGLDVMGRVEYQPAKWISIGANGGYKNVENAADEQVDAYAAGGDIRFRAAGLYTAVEFDVGQDWSFDLTTADDPDRGLPWTLGVVGYVLYNFKVGEQTTLQPIVLAEWADSNSFYLQSEAMRIVAGFNTLWTDHIRIMPQVELVLPLGEASAFNRWAREETYYVMLSFQK